MSTPLGPRIVTTYGKDGTKTRKPMGFPGSTCSLATQPYEVREIAGQTKKTPTGEANEPEPTAVEILESVKLGG